MIQHASYPVLTASGRLIQIFVWVFFEGLVWAGIMVISERPWPWLARVYGRIEGVFSSFARRRRLAIISIFLLVFVGRLALLPILHVPPPKIWDEFGQLLSGDTFAHWRPTNATHPMWFYLQTYMVNQKPTYNSMYPPGAGLFLAAGEILTGQPWYGMLFSVALGAAAICWMLQGWMPPRWALWGALVFVLLCARNALTENYLGEGVVVLGGALVLGAIPRIVKRGSFAASIWLGIGIALLAVTRPYEGAVFVAGIGIGGIYWARTRGLKGGTLLKRAAVPVAAILLPVLVWIGYLNWRTTGNPLLTPYQLNLEQQHVTRPFYWQRPVSEPVHYDYAEMASGYRQWELDWWKSTHGFPRGLSLFLADKAEVMYSTIVWPLGFVLGVGCYEFLKKRGLRFLPLALFFFVGGLGLEAYQLQTRYVEAAWGLVLLLGTFGVRYVGVWKRKSRHGLRISRAAVVCIPLVLALCSCVFVTQPLRHGRGEPAYRARWQALHALEALPGYQLVIVRYAASHGADEWVYNRADINGAKVVWARYAPQTGDADLLQYFKGRTAWLLEPDGKFAKLTLYSERNAEDAPSQVGAFRIFCSDPVCEDLERELRLAR